MTALPAAGLRLFPMAKVSWKLLTLTSSKEKGLEKENEKE